MLLQRYTKFKMQVLLFPVLFFLSGILLLLSNQQARIYKAVSKLTLLAAFVVFAVLITTKASFHYDILPFLKINNIAFTVILQFDLLSRIMTLFILLIGASILFYSYRYLRSDLTQGRFLAQIHFVIASVLLLVLSANLLSTFIAWQLIGISLYLLLNHYHFDIYANKAAKKKFIINRIGDLAFLLAVVLVYQSQDNSLFASLVGLHQQTFIALLIFIAVMTKSAQFPFQIWLPDTLEAPTPVSALMHAGIINAGGYLLIRCAPIMVQHQAIMVLIMVIGTVTALLGNFAMQRQYSVKRQLAYSTMGQMGFMIFQCGTGLFSAALFHLIAHGFLKGYLFLNSGSNLKLNVKESAPRRSWWWVFVFFVPLFFLCVCIARFFHLDVPLLFWGFIVITTYDVVCYIVRYARDIRSLMLPLCVLLLIILTYLTMIDWLALQLHMDYYWINSRAVEVSILLVYLSLQALVYFGANKLALYVPHMSKTEKLCRVYILKPFRHLGDFLNKFLAMLNNTPIRYSFTLGVVVLYLIAIVMNHQLIMSSASAFSLSILWLYLMAMLIMIVANRAVTLLQVTLWIGAFQVVILSILFIGFEVNNIALGLYAVFNTSLIIVALLLINKGQVTLNLNTQVSNKLTWPVFYLSVSLLMLIGIPGTPSFITELYLFKVLTSINIFLALAYAINMLFLSIVVMHALQIYVFKLHSNQAAVASNNRRLHAILPIIFAINLYSGIYPEQMLALIRGML